MTNRRPAAFPRRRLRAAIALSLLAIFLCLHPAASGAQAPPKKPPSAKKEQSLGPLEALWRSAEQALEKEDYSAAAKALEEYVSYWPDDPFAHFQLGYAYTGLKRWEDARREYTRATELDPKLAPAYLNLGLLHLEREGYIGATG